MDELLPRNGIARGAAIAAAAAWLLLGFYLAFLDDRAPQALTPVAEAAERTSQAEGFRFEISGVVTVPQGTMRMEGNGAFAGADDRFSMQLSMGGLPGFGAVDFEEVADGSDFYVSSPMFSGTLPGGKTWMKIDIGEMLGEGMNADPREQLDELESVANVSVVGTEKIDGVPTTRYRAVVDASAAGLEAASAGSQIPTDVWIDGDGYIRRQTVRTAPGFMGGAMGMDLRMEFHGFGATPAITVPPDELVFDGSELLEQMGGLEALQQ